MGEGEGVAGETDKVFGDEFSVPVAGDVRITVKFVIAGRHDHTEVVVVGQRLYAGTVYPVGIVAENAVQQVQRFERLFLRNRHAGENNFVGRDDDVNRDGTHQRFGKKVNSSKCHGNSLLSL